MSENPTPKAGGVSRMVAPSPAKAPAPTASAPAPAAPKAPAFAPDDLRQFLLARAAEASACERVPVSFLGQPLFVTRKTSRRADERDAWNYRQLAAKGLGETDTLTPERLAERERLAAELVRPFRAILIVDCLCDSTGRLVLQIEDTARIAELPPEVLAPVFDAAQKVSGLEESAKN